ncbi:unnamed protein product, partial [Scytosiphon promiscuus]
SWHCSCCCRSAVGRRAPLLSRGGVLQLFSHQTGLGCASYLLQCWSSARQETRSKLLEPLEQPRVVWRSKLAAPYIGLPRTKHGRAVCRPKRRISFSFFPFMSGA